jgi:hypothetical protein
MVNLQGNFLVASGSWKMEVFVGNPVGDGVARVKAQYAEAGGNRSNKAYGYVLAG